MDRFNNLQFNSTPCRGAQPPHGIMRQQFDTPIQNNSGGVRPNEDEELIRWQPLNYESDQHGNNPNDFTTESPFVPFPAPGPFPGGVQPAFVPNPNAIPEHSNMEKIPQRQLKPEETNLNKPNTGLAEDRTASSSFRFMKIKKRLGLCAIDHPRDLLTPFELEALASEILEKILSPEGRSVRPRFFGVDVSRGFLDLVCGDDRTVSWVKSLPRTLKTARGVRLKVLEELQDDKIYIAVGHFPHSENEPNSRIMRFLSIQNEGLDCSRWMVLNREHEMKGGVRLTFSIDWASAQSLKSRGPNLNYKFGCSRFLLKTIGDGEFREEDPGEDSGALEEFLRTPSGYPNPFAYPETKFSTWGEGLLTPGSRHQTTMLGENEYLSQIGRMMEESRKTLLQNLTRETLGSKKKKKKSAKKKKKRKQNGAAGLCQTGTNPQRTNPC